MDAALNLSAAFLRAVRSALPAAAGPVIDEVRTRRWTSANFRGARHDFTLRFEGADAPEAADRFVQRLERSELDMPGQIVAEVSIVSNERRPNRARLRIEVLTVEG